MIDGKWNIYIHTLLVLPAVSCLEVALLGVFTKPVLNVITLQGLNASEIDPLSHFTMT